MVRHSHACNFPSAKKTRLTLDAAMKKTISRTKLRRATRNGLTKAMEPATIEVINPAAPRSSPTARLPLLELMAAKVENTSGLPFPNARNVTPVKLSLMPRMLAMVLRFMQRKSLAAMPMVLKSSASHSVMMVNASGFALARLQ